MQHQHSRGGWWDQLQELHDHANSLLLVTLKVLAHNLLIAHGEVSKHFAVYLHRKADIYMQLCYIVCAGRHPHLLQAQKQALDALHAAGLRLAAALAPPQSLQLDQQVSRRAVAEEFDDLVFHQG